MRSGWEQPEAFEEEDAHKPESRESLEQRYRRALDAAAKQLSYRQLSVSALRKKLMEKGHAEDAAEYALAWLLERGLLNDAELAAAMVRSYARRGYGMFRIRQEMIHRGISRSDADIALEGHSAEPDQLTKLLHKRLRGDMSDRREVNKAVAALQRRGFGWNEIKKALSVYKERLADGEYEED
ncbi:MAG: regulatory protein RecX [Clostridiaceae bacterium]|nr:regulatory protein RecX [Clostridiaceae bacterium]